MKIMLGFATMMIVVLLLAPDFVQGQKKDQKNMTVTAASPQDYKTLERTKEITNCIIASASGKSVTFRIDNAKVAPNTGKPRPGAGVKVVHEYKEYDLDLADNVVIKKMFVSSDFDDKGNFVKVNEEQQKELRKNGFIAVEVNGIKSGNVAKLVLTPGKKAEKDEAAAKPMVKTIYLLQEGTPPDPVKTPEKKKKT